VALYPLLTIYLTVLQTVLCLNSANFDAGNLFNERKMNVARCISTVDYKRLYSDKDITDLIPKSRKMVVNCGSRDCDMVIDTGTDLTIIVKPKHLTGVFL